VSQKNAVSGSSQTTYFFTPFASTLPQPYSVDIPVQHGFNGFPNFELPEQGNKRKGRRATVKSMA
jgi:hypothetical protein